MNQIVSDSAISKHPLSAEEKSKTRAEELINIAQSSSDLNGHSYTVNPISCASALASLDLLLVQDCEKQRTMITSSHTDFVKKWKNHPKLKRCESLGTILALEYRDDNCTYFSTLSDDLYQFFIKQKMLLRPLGNVLYVLPPYCITQEELNLIYDTTTLTLEGDR
ncbi:MAG: aminotransferase class III-fold pyridoxal phosphate-dependent enzyme [Chlamydiales bacterium]